MTSPRQAWSLPADLCRTLLVELGLAVRRFLRGRATSAESADREAREGPGDTLYGIDRSVEPTVLDALSRWPTELTPALVVGEGLGAEGTLRIGPREGALKTRLLLDPIDGTRLLMHDKRAAWVLAALAPDRGEGTRLSDSVAAALVELPTSKQGWADELSATQHGTVHATRRDVTTGEGRPLSVAPSQATTLDHGFGQVVNFHPGGKVLAADLGERIAAHAAGAALPGRIVTFEDHYLSTGGQMVELLTGRDRITCDLRPLLARAGAPAPACCHPHDVAGALVARRAGVILTDGFGRELDAPFALDVPVHWCGYANQTLRARIEPVIQAWLAEHGIRP